MTLMRTCLHRGRPAGRAFFGWGPLLAQAASPGPRCLLPPRAALPAQPPGRPQSRNGKALRPPERMPASLTRDARPASLLSQRAAAFPNPSLGTSHSAEPTWKPGILFTERQPWDVRVCPARSVLPAFPSSLELTEEEMQSRR